MDPYLGQIQAFGFDFAPKGWMLCQGQLLTLSQYQALFALLGTTFGGNGQTNFALPDLRGRTIVGAGQGTGLSPIVCGKMAGMEMTTLLTENMPVHQHLLTGVKVTTVVQTVDNTNESSDSNFGINVLGTSGNMPSIYREGVSGNDHLGGITSFISGSTDNAGSSLPFSLRDPYLGMSYCIACQGIYPVRD